MLTYLSHKTALGNAKRALSAAQFYIRQFGNMRDMEEIKIHTIGYIDMMSVNSGIPTFLELYAERKLREPLFNDPNLSRLANWTTKQYCYGPKDNKDYFLNAVATAYFSILSTPPLFSGRQELWIKLIDFVDIHSLQEAIVQASEPMQNS